MKCPICKYHWCYVCGLPYLSFFHYSQYGGLVCELIGGSLFNDNKCKAVSIFLLVTIFLPLIIYFMGILLVGCGLFYSFEYLLKNKSFCFPIKTFFTRTYQSTSCIHSVWVWGLRIFRFILYLLIFIIFFALSLSGGSVVGAILIIPCTIIYFVVLIRIQFYWRKKGKK